MNLAFAFVLHLLAAVIWVGGLFFAHQVLRAVAAVQLETPARLTLWKGVFVRFFPWVWGAVVILPLTGYYLLYTGFGDMENAPLYVHLMNGLGLLMIALFLFMFFGPYARFTTAVAAQAWPDAGARLTTMRRIVGANLLLGLVTIIVAASGSYF